MHRKKPLQTTVQSQMPVMQNGQVPAPKVETFQINDVSAYTAIDKYRVS